jgi:hypothetical protein
MLSVTPLRPDALISSPACAGPPYTEAVNDSATASLAMMEGADAAAALVTNVRRPLVKRNF